MPWVRSLFLTCAAALILPGCRERDAARIGDAFPRDQVNKDFLATIRPAIESTGTQISTWTVKGNPAGSTIQLNTEQASRFADDPSVVAVVGHAGSRDALLGAAVYHDRGVPNVVPNSTSSRLADFAPWIFTLVPNDSIQGEFIAGYAIDSLHAARVSILYLGDEYGIGLRDGLRGALERRGRGLADASMIPSEACFSFRSAGLFKSVIAGAMRRANADVVVVTAGSPDGWCVADFIHAANPETWIVFTDGMEGARTLPDPRRGLPDSPLRINAAKVRGVDFWDARADSMSRAFDDRIQHVLHRPAGSGDALQYDAFMLISAAISESGPSRSAVRKWLESLGRTREPWPGVTGPIYFNRPRTELLRMAGPSGALP